MFKINSKQRLAIKSWFFAMVPLETAAGIDYVTNTHATGGLFVRGLGLALLAPIGRSVYPRYLQFAKKFPKYVPFAKRLIAREAKRIAKP